MQFGFVFSTACILAFLALVFLVTVVVCRIHVRRCRHIFHLASGTTPRQPLSLHDLEVLMHLRRTNHNPFIGIVYNINNGVQMVGGNRNVTPPPPYNQEGQNEPPPPYDGLVAGAHGGFAHQGTEGEVYTRSGGHFYVTEFFTAKITRKDERSFELFPMQQS